VDDLPRLALAAGVSLAATWLVFLVLLAAWRPRGMDLREAKRLVPDVVRLVRAVSADPATAVKVRRRLGLLLAYLALPIDLVPDFLPVLGYADDVVIIAVVLRSIVRAVGPDVIDRHWTGTSAGLAVVRRLAGLSDR